ncbi:DUF2442 domain-containing protein [Solibaculum mannosilyticum]|uniref:DUF2442 domain-containing protein n=1 Tax=Solibaculum mannosilyticum TaxID=2780922 RepID=UPI000B7FADFE
MRREFHEERKEKLPDYKLFVMFEGGEQKKYDVNPLFSRWDVFQVLKSIDGLFQQVYVDVGGYGICWNEDIDLSCEELWDNGELMEGIENAK